MEHEFENAEESILKFFWHFWTIRTATQWTELIIFILNNFQKGEFFITILVEEIKLVGEQIVQSEDPDEANLLAIFFSHSVYQDFDSKKKLKEY